MRRRGFTLIEILVIIAIVGILAAIAIPQLLGARAKRITARCDNLYVALNGQLANELDALANGVPGPRCPTARTFEDIRGCLVERHADTRNPRNGRQPAYTLDPPESCQVQLFMTTHADGLPINFAQYVYEGSTTSRTFSVLIE